MGLYLTSGYCLYFLATYLHLRDLGLGVLKGMLEEKLVRRESESICQVRTEELCFWFV